MIIVQIQEEEKLLEPEQYAEKIKTLLAPPVSSVDGLIRELGKKA